MTADKAALPQHFRKKPVVIEAVQYRGNNELEVMEWAHRGLHPESNAIITKEMYGLRVRTLEGDIFATMGDWIIKGVKGEFYPCKPDIFAATYEPAE